MSNPIFDLSGRAALVTGGSRGLGRAMFEALLTAGARVVIISRHETDLRATVDALATPLRARAAYVVGDLAKPVEIARVAAEAEAQVGPIDVLVNNAGASVPQAVDEVTDDAFDEVVAVNLRAAMALTRAVTPGMKERRWGRIVHVGSVLGAMSRPGRSVYSATKAALLGLARGQAADLGPYGITVNCLVPGPFRTDISERSIHDDATARRFEERTALGRFGELAELGGPIVLLASGAGSYITGSALVVDGGWLAQ